MKLQNPPHLNPGDRIAAVTLSTGLAGALPYRYQIGKKQLQQELDLQLVEMKHTLKDIDWIQKNPQARADDLMEAFSDPTIKGIFSVIGGNDSIRLLPHIDFNIISANPKVFMGYSDTTVAHFMCNKAGLTSFYGPSILSNLAENCGILPYTINYLKKALFSTQPIDEIIEAPEWTAQYLDWFNPENQNIKRQLQKSDGRKILQGHETVVSGFMMGGCVQVLNTLYETELWPESEKWRDSIVFLEISESILSPNTFCDILRKMGSQGIWDKANSIIFARPGGQRSQQEFLEYEKNLTDVIGLEYNRPNLPIMSNMDFGHTDPVFILPYGVKTEIDCKNKKLTILEPSVI